MSAERLRDALGRLAVDARVEARDRLAVLHPRTARDARRAAAERARSAALATEHGFTHVALELGTGEAGDDAPLSRD